MANVPLIGYHDASPEAKAVFEKYVLPGQHKRHPEFEVSDADLYVTPPWRAWANAPDLMKYMALLTNYIADECPWSIEHVPLRELMVVAIYRKYPVANYGLLAHEDIASLHFTEEQLDALNDLSTAKSCDLFNAEEKTILAFTESALANGDCAPDVWADIVQRYGNRGAVELTAIFGFWLMWVPVYGMFGVVRDPSQEH